MTSPSGAAPPPSTAERITELELRYLELQRDVDVLSELVRDLDGRVVLLTDRLERLLAQGEDPIDPTEAGPFDTRW